MAIGDGIRKIYAGLGDILMTPLELYEEIKWKRRDALSGKYKVRIPAESGVRADGEIAQHPPFIAHITFHGGRNTHDVDAVTLKDGTATKWDDLPGGTRFFINGTVINFLNDLMEQHGVSPWK
jgi:hypothetical protein